jgi:hypothetical protein
MGRWCAEQTITYVLGNRRFNIARDFDLSGHACEQTSGFFFRWNRLDDRFATFGDDDWLAGALEGPAGMRFIGISKMFIVMIT